MPPLHSEARTVTDPSTCMFVTGMQSAWPIISYCYHLLLVVSQLLVLGWLRFFGKSIRVGKLADALILDEVDNMMLDSATKTLYISHPITDMRHLRDVFLHIWAAVNGKESAYTEDNVRKIMEYVKKFTSCSEEVRIDHDALTVKFDGNLGRAEATLSKEAGDLHGFRSFEDSLCHSFQPG